MSSGRSEDILKQRAQVLCLPPAPETSEGLALTLFVRHEMLLGVKVDEVAGAGNVRQLSPIPRAPAWMLGAVFHRGEVLTLIDLPAFWGLDLRRIVDLPTYVVISDGRSKVGVLAEDLRGVQEVAASVTAWRGEPRQGVCEVGRHQDRPVAIISAQALLSDPRLTG
jgi:purine-binding chemotaxis protein CheW